MTDEPDVRKLVLRSGWSARLGPGRLPALYVMVTADGHAAKVGALESAANAWARLRRVEAHHRKLVVGAAGYAMRLAVVAELADLAIGGDHDVESEERWAEVEHLESALRLVLARRLGRVARWTDWIHVDSALSNDEWARAVEEAWHDVDALGRAASSGT